MKLRNSILILLHIFRLSNNYHIQYNLDSGIINFAITAFSEVYGFLIFKNINLTALTLIKTKFKFLLINIELIKRYEIQKYGYYKFINSFKIKQL